MVSVEWKAYRNENGNSTGKQKIVKIISTICIIIIVVVVMVILCRDCYHINDIYLLLFMHSLVVTMTSLAIYYETFLK